MIRKNKKVMWHKNDIRSRYDVVIIGAGVHGLAIAYYLAKRGITNVAVLDKGYIGGGNSGRNTAILRANYRTVEGVNFYKESLKLYEDLTQELNFNLLFAPIGHLTLAHTDTSLSGLRLRAEVNKQLGLESYLVDREELKDLEPKLDLSDKPRYPIMGALYHPPGGIIRHDAVVWGYAKEADKMGVEIHPKTEVKNINLQRDGSYEIITNKKNIRCNTVVNATAGWCSDVAKMVDLKIPVVTQQLQACVTESMNKYLSKVIVSANLHVYVSQTDRGEFVLGATIDPYSSYSYRSTFPTLHAMVSHTIELFPEIAKAKILRQWAGICDMTPDYAPIMGKVPGHDGFILDVGWGTWGFKSGPISGKLIAELISTGKTPELIKPFSIKRFEENRPIGEKAAAAVS